jgi:hypothetical protein
VAVLVALAVVVQAVSETLLLEKPLVVAVVLNLFQQ